MEANIDKIVFGKIVKEFKIISIGLPSSLEVTSLLKNECISDTWWTGDNPYGKHGFRMVNYVSENTVVATDIYTTERGVRPMVYFTEPNNLLKQNDEFFLENWLFKVLAPGVAICETVIGYRPYKLKEQIDVPDFCMSPIFSLISSWITKYANAVCFKVTREKLTNVFPVISLPSYDIISKHHSAFISNGSPYWLRTRYNEFTGYYVSDSGHIGTKDISEKLSIAPSVYLNSSNKFKLIPFDRIIIGDRAFKLLDSETGFCICTNPLPSTCYSTGIEELQNNDSAFIRDSEAYKTMVEWVTLNKLNKYLVQGGNL